MNADQKLRELNQELPPPAKPAGVYNPIVILNNMAYVSGHSPIRPDGSMMTGKIGSAADQQAGYDAARQTGLAMLATLQDSLGSLDRVERLVKTLGLVNATPDFEQHPDVLNGFSELMAQVFGQDRGIGARSAVGAASLPFNITVEIEAIFQIKS